MTRDHGVQARLYTYLSRHPGVVFTTAELRRELNVANSGTIGSALTRLRLNHNIQSPVRGSWVYRGEGRAGDIQPSLPVPPPPGQLPTAAGHLQVIALSGDLVVARDKPGHIWVMRMITRESQAA